MPRRDPPIRLRLPAAAPASHRRCFRQCHRRPKRQSGRLKGTSIGRAPSRAVFSANATLIPFVWVVDCETEREGGGKSTNNAREGARASEGGAGGGAGWFVRTPPDGAGRGGRRAASDAPRRLGRDGMGRGRRNCRRRIIVAKPPDVRTDFEAFFRRWNAEQG